MRWLVIGFNVSKKKVITIYWDAGNIYYSGLERNKM